MNALIITLALIGGTGREDYYAKLEWRKANVIQRRMGYNRRENRMSLRALYYFRRNSRLWGTGR